MAVAKDSSLWANRRCIIICTAVSMANMQYGFDSAAVGALQAMPGFLKEYGYEDPSNPIGYGIDGTVQQLMTSLLTLGSFITTLAAGLFGTYFGRRWALWTACALNAVAAAVQIGSTSLGALYFGRLCLGFANGFFVVFSNVYTSEAAPAHLRGVIVALYTYWVNIGSITGSIVVNYTKSRPGKDAYQIPLGCLYIVPTILAFSLIFCPESPRWLLRHGKEEQARKALDKLRGSRVNPTEVEFEWVEMLRGVEEDVKNEKNARFVDLFRGSDLRRTLLCWGMIVSHNASGIWFLIGYQTYFMRISHIGKAFEYSIMTTTMGFVGVNFSMYAMRCLFGRRTILLAGATFCGTCFLIMAIYYTVSDPTAKSTGQIIVAFTALFKFGYSAGVGGASYPVATEVVSSQLRAHSIGTANMWSFLFAWLTGFCTPYFINPTELNWGAKYGYIWAAANYACIVFFYFFVPETKGRTLEELDEIFVNRVPTRKFKAYKCRIRDEAEHDLKVGNMKDEEAAEAVAVHVEKK